jgi:hypothetical protein
MNQATTILTSTEAASGYALRDLARAPKTTNHTRKEQTDKIFHSQQSKLGFHPWLKFQSTGRLNIQSARTL